MISVEMNSTLDAFSKIMGIKTISMFQFHSFMDVFVADYYSSPTRKLPDGFSPELLTNMTYLNNLNH